MDITTPEQAHEAISEAVERASDRYVETLTGGEDPVRFDHVLSQELPAMVARVLRSVEASFWTRELTRRQNDSRFEYDDPALEKAQNAWNASLRKTMRLSRKELRQLANRALKLQMETMVAPVEAMKVNYFDRQETTSAKSAIIVATHLGLEERYVRALTLMAQDDENRPITADEFRRIARDVDAKEHHGSSDRVALGSLSEALLVLKLRSDDELGAAPVDLAKALFLLRGTAEGLRKVTEAAEGKPKLEMDEIEALFLSEEEREDDDEGGERTEEVSRFLEDLGVDGDIITADEASGDSGGVRFILTDEEKQAYVGKAVGRHVHLIDPIMKAIDGALTWEEVDRSINEMLPDELRDEDLQARNFRSRIR